MARRLSLVRIAVLAWAPALAGAACGGSSPLSAPEPVAAVSLDTASSLASYHRAYGAVERSVRALFGQEPAPDALDAVSFRLEMVGLAPYQSPTPEPPFLEVSVALEVAAAPGRRWARIETVSRLPEVDLHTLRLLGPEGAAEVDPLSGRATEAAFEWADLERDFRRSPHLVVRDAWNRRADLRWLGIGETDGVPVDRVAFPFLGRRQLTLTIDREGRLLRHEYLFDDLRTGDSLVVARFLDWRREEGRWTPHGFEQREAGLAAVRGSYTRLHLEESPKEELFRAAGAPAKRGGAGAAAFPTAGPPPTTELAPGVHLVELVPGGEYNSLLVDLGAAFAVVEAPLGPDAAAKIVSAARHLDPEKPIRYVVATHFHADHTGGLPHVVALTGATVVTSPGNEEFFQDVTAARRTLEGVSVIPDGPAELLVVDGETELPGERPLRLVEVGPTGHAEESLIAWLPEPGIVFQGDLMRFPVAGDLEPARESALPGLVQLLEVVGSRADVRVAGVHGRVGTVEELRRALD